MTCINHPHMEAEQGGTERMNGGYHSHFSGAYVQTPGVCRQNVWKDLNDTLCFHSSPWSSLP